MVCAPLLSEKKKKNEEEEEKMKTKLKKCRGHFLQDHTLSLGINVSPEWCTTDTSSWVGILTDFNPI